MAKEHDERVRERAYQLWREGGGRHGQEMEHWLQAEREVSGAGKTEKKAGKAPKETAPVKAEAAPAKKAAKTDAPAEKPAKGAAKPASPSKAKAGKKA